MRLRVSAVAVANRHTVAVVEGGHVYSWGCNLQGQLGYGTSDSASNAVPRIVEAMKVSRAPTNDAAEYPHRTLIGCLWRPVVCVRASITCTATVQWHCKDLDILASRVPKY